jgi:ceramide glucosyltransferase
MVVRRKCLEDLGGFGFMADYHADDYFLGNAVAKSGAEVVLSHHTIDHMVVHESFSSSIHHQVGWMRSTRFSRPKGHFGTILTFGMPYGILGLFAGMASGYPRFGVLLLAFTTVGRILQSVFAGYIAVGDRAALTLSWLYPLRDLLGAFVWAGSYLSSTMKWRGELYLLNDGGRLTRIAEDDSVPIAPALESHSGTRG